ncbi:MAG TPA: hypothetical protein VFV34_02065 [Blastocatellia bacterium]|nr:hypothetical protein [Blastocatellia bacterium]
MWATARLQKLALEVAVLRVAALPGGKADQADASAAARSPESAAAIEERAGEPAGRRQVSPAAARQDRFLAVPDELVELMAAKAYWTEAEPRVSSVRAEAVRPE